MKRKKEILHRSATEQLADRSWKKRRMRFSIETQLSYLESWNFLFSLMPLKATESSWNWEWALQLVGSSCGFGCWSSGFTSRLDGTSITLTAMLQLCSWFRRWNTSGARRLLPPSILAFFFTPQLLRRRSIKPTSRRRDRTSIGHSSHPHKRTVNINTCLIN